MTTLADNKYDIAVISTHTPLARRDDTAAPHADDRKISTHTPLARRDTQFFLLRLIHNRFLLTRLSRGVTYGSGHHRLPDRFLLTRLSRGVTDEAVSAIKNYISTHTPLARRDITVKLHVHQKTDFYSHASREA